MLMCGSVQTARPGRGRMRASPRGATGSAGGPWMEWLVQGSDRGRRVSDILSDSRAEAPAMHPTGIAGLVCVLLLSGCAALRAPPSDAPLRSSPPQGEAEVGAPVDAAPSLPSAPPVTPATTAGVATVEPAGGSAPLSTAAAVGQSTGRTAPTEPKAAARVPASPAAAAPPPKKEGIPPDIAKAKAPPLDLASLEQRLKDTKAIGVLTKITLKNQVDDLLNQFRAFYQGKLRSDLADLRRSYDRLVLKVLSLLQDSDQALATAIVASREAIWGILSDPAKFAKI